MVARGEPTMREEACNWEWWCEDELQRHYCLTHCLHYSCADQCTTHNVTTIHEDGAWELARSTPGYNMYCLLISWALGVRQCLHFFTNEHHYARYLLSGGLPKCVHNLEGRHICNDLCSPWWHLSELLGTRLVGPVQSLHTATWHGNDHNHTTEWDPYRNQGDFADGVQWSSVFTSI